MIATLETKACQACAKGKRRCAKEMPECSRCTRRGIDCTYPPSKPSCFVLLEEDYSSTSSLSAYTATSIIPSHGLAFPPYYYPLTPADTHLSSIWFNRPSTWQITPWPQAALDSLRASNIKRLITQIQQWFAQWISTGSSPFIHHQLYRHHLPQCVHDAYTTLSAYLHRTPQNEHLIFQILEARVTQLLADQGLSSPANPTDSIGHHHSSTDLSTLDTLGHLARVQTLTTYLLVMLFNGDIRLRHIAERHIPLLEAWMQQMVDDARTNTFSPGSLIDPFHSDTLWHAWILAESLRRTFLVGRSVVALYEILKAGKPVPGACKGGMVFTIRRGAWEAKSAAEWEDLAAEVNLGLMQVGDARRWVLSRGISREQVDSFATTFVEGTCGDVWS